MTGNGSKTPIKPILRYFGGKWNLAPWIISHLPPHRIYVEPFGGAASVLLRKERSFSEVYNDLNGDVVNLFRVLQDRGTFDELHRTLRFTPYARDEFEAAYQVSDNPIEQARRLLIRSWMGVGSAGTRYSTGFRTNVICPRRSTPATDWKRLIDHLDLVVERLRGVAIENRPAHQVMIGHDTLDTLHYVDPPYPRDTRERTARRYQHEMEIDEHHQLADTLKQLQGMVVISGYACDLYDRVLYPDWIRLERGAFTVAAAERTEVLWISPNAWDALKSFKAARTGPQQMNLFGERA